jgi:hypothetical protein
VKNDQAHKLAIDFCGLKFATPLVLLSGCVGFGEEYTRVEGYSNRDVGAVCLNHRLRTNYVISTLTHFLDTAIERDVTVLSEPCTIFLVNLFGIVVSAVIISETA